MIQSQVLQHPVATRDQLGEILFPLGAHDPGSFQGRFDLLSRQSRDASSHPARVVFRHRQEGRVIRDRVKANHAERSPHSTGTTLNRGTRELPGKGFDILRLPPESAVSPAQPWSRGPILGHEGSNTLWHVVTVLAPARGVGLVTVVNEGLSNPAPNRLLSALVGTLD